ncbi:4894_t:CDS:2 [Funneliformis geosporum]|uniref:10923_t:CDS:1 n=1 Tax=Funneliformis geosporum TaxID=1117311 RepID=A0A9W4SNF8_9GLOM|nr:4894_t:CDS:2 [Funneliformis geosporum]CAI2175503.1 10923_t:CDS:2 [Funneliformis geosporum]
MSSSDQIPFSSNDDNFAYHNKLHFNSEAKNMESDPFNLMVAKKCGEAIINEIKSELDPDKTEVMDFACGTGLISQALCPYVKSIMGVDSAQAMVDEFNKKIWQQGIDESEMKAICLDLKESEGDQLDGRKFDFVVVGISILQCASAYHHISDIAAITRILASYLKPSGKLIVLDITKDPELVDKFKYFQDKHKHVEHTVAHKGGFYHNEIEEVFLNTRVLEDVKVEIAFTFNKFLEKDQKEYTFKYLIAKGRKKE